MANGTAVPMALWYVDGIEAKPQVLTRVYLRGQPLYRRENLQFI
jgi:hypothetical protein